MHTLFHNICIQFIREINTYFNYYLPSLKIILLLFVRPFRSHFVRFSP